MRIAIAQLNFHIGNIRENKGKIIEYIRKAKEEKAELIIFPELSICGYPPKDFLYYNDFVSQCKKAINEIAKVCVEIAAIVGGPEFNEKSEGKRLYNSAYFLADGIIKNVHHKALLPNYDVFDEYRYFEPGREFFTETYKVEKIAVTICEDLWNLTDQPLYNISPLDEIAEHKPDLIVNIAASPFNYNQKESRIEIFKRNAKKYKLPLCYVNQAGAQTELLFDGGSMYIDEEGEIREQMKFFGEDFKIVDTERLKDKVIEIKQEKISLIHDALVMGIKDYFKKLNFKKAILGLSGGLDSAVTLVLAERALGKENVRSVLMPSEFSSQHSIDDSLKLVNNLDSSYEIIPIKDTYDSFQNTLQPLFKGREFDVTEENLQARTRAVILMALCNKFSYILLNTSNKSEAAVGYGTLYGDMCGGISVLGDLYKTQVYQLANFINREKEIIPQNIINKPPSAELRPNQKDSDSLPEYEVLDKILFEYIENNRSAREIIEQGAEEEVVNKVVRMVNLSEHKRAQAPPILRVSPRAFGTGRRMPIVAKW